MQEICNEDQCNDTYGRMRMYQALQLKNPDGVKIPEEKTVYRIMKKIGLTHHPKRKPNGITKADREAMKSDDLLKRDFCSDEPLKKCITDITEIKAKDGKLYTSDIDNIKRECQGKSTNSKICKRIILLMKHKNVLK